MSDQYITVLSRASRDGYLAVLMSSPDGEDYSIARSWKLSSTEKIQAEREAMSKAVSEGVEYR